MNRKRIVITLCAVLVVAGLLAVRHERIAQRNRAPVLSEAPTAVQVVTVKRGALESVDHVLGVVYGADEAAIAPRVSGQVLEVLVREGTPVAQGATLARIDARELEDAVAEGQANVEAAQAVHEAQLASTGRDSVLFVAGAISEEQWESSQTARTAADRRLEVARRRLDQAKVQLGYSVLRAPFTGVVSARMADPGDLAVTGRPVLRMVRQHAVRVRGMIPPALMTRLRPGTGVDLTLGDERVAAAVSRIFPSMQSSHLATLEIDVADPTPGFVAGATVGIDLHLETGTGLLVPTDALLEGDAGTYAFVVDRSDHGAQALRVVPVTVATRSLDQAIVAGDLHEGDRVVVARPSRLMSLAAGMHVRALDTTPGS